MPSKSDSCRLSNGLEKDSWFVGTYSIISPYTGETAEFTLSSSEVQTVHDSHFKMHRSNELIETIIFACYENEELLHDVRLNELISAVQPNQAASLKCLVDHFNSLSMVYFKRHGPYDQSPAAKVNSAKHRTSTADIEIARGARAKSFTLVPGVALRRVRHSRFLSHIVQLCYNRAVVEPSELNKQKPFSTQTYGETMFTFIEHMVKHLFFEPDVTCDDQTGPSSSAIASTTIGPVHEFVGWRAKRMSPDDRFIDLGSGVGQVVLQLAASVAYERPVVGVEKASVPQRYADYMAREFVRWMRFFARGYSPFALVGDDFLEPAYADLIKRSTVVFANNFLFGPRVDLQLTQLFAELPEGARVVSSKRFCDEPSKITERTANDISAIMRVDTFDALVGAVSWTSTAFSFYLQTIDRTRLERYYFAQRHRANPDADDIDLCTSSESHAQALNVASPNATVSSSRSNSIASYRAASARRRGNMALRNVQTRVTRLIADDDALHVRPAVSAAATSVDCSSPPSSTSVSTPVSTPTVDADKPTRAVDALQKRLKVHISKQFPVSPLNTRRDPLSSGTQRSPTRKKRKLEPDSDCGTSSVLELFHAQADALANGSSHSDSRSCDASPYSATNVYPSSIFNLREYNDCMRERIECSLMRLAEAKNSPSTPAMSSSASSFVTDTSTQSPPSTSRSTSLSRSSTSGVFSAARPSNVDREEIEQEVVGNCESELMSTMRRLTDQSTSSTSLIGLLRSHVDQQRAHNATVAKKADVVARFITSRRSRLNTLLEDYERMEVTDNTSQPSDDPAGRILEHYSLSIRRVQQQEQRRSELRAGVSAARSMLDASRNLLMPIQPAALSINANLSGGSSAYTNVSPAESQPTPTLTPVPALTPPIADTRQPPIALSVSSPYPHYATLCQTAPLALGNRVGVGVNLGGSGLLQAYNPASLMQPTNLNMSSNLGIQIGSAPFGGVDAAAQRFAVTSSAGNTQLPSTAFFGVLPGAHTQHTHPNLNLPVYPTLYTNTSHAL